MRFLSDVAEWAVATGWWWVVLMSGWVGLALGLFERFRGEPVKSWVFMIVGGLAVMFASFMTWRSERSAYNAEHQALLDEKKAHEINIDIRIANLISGTAVNGGKTIGTALTVELWVANKGLMPSVLIFWRLKIRPLSGGEITAELQSAPASTTTLPLSKGGAIKFSGPPLQDVVAINPVPAGGAVTGWMQFIAHGLLETSLDGGSMTIDCIDVKGGIHSVTAPIGGSHGTTASIHVPGIKAKVIK